MVSPSTISERDLHAYFDRQMDDPAQIAAVEAYLAAHPEEEARLREYRRVEDALRVGLDKVAQEPVPEALRAAVLAPPRRASWVAAAAGCGGIVLGALLGWWLHGDPAASGDGWRQALVEPARMAYAVYTPEVRHPVEVTAKEEGHLAAWLTKRLGARVTVPHLQAAGFNLVGGRLLPASDGSPAAQFMYEDDTGKRVTLYVRRTDGAETQAAFRYDVRDGVGVFYWVDAEFAYALSGELTRERLLVAARMAYQALNP